MALKSTAAALIEGPITDAGQLLLALVINELAGPDGWLVHTRKDLAKATRTSCLKASRKRIETMVKMGYLEERKKPIPGLRLTEKALSGGWASYPPKWASDPSKWALDPSEQGGLQTHPNGCDTHPSGHLTPAPNASAYLPKRSKDKKEVEEKEIAASPPPTPPAELVLVADNPSPENTPRFDQPAAQPPAIVEQAESRPDELLPAKRKAAPPKAKRVGSVIALPDDWRADDKLLASLAKNNGIPIEFSQRLIDEFVDYWRESGGRKKSWNQAFRNWAKSEWEREQKRAKTQRYTDASGRPISERDATTRERNQRFLATLESGLLDNFDLDQPV